MAGPKTKPTLLVGVMVHYVAEDVPGEQAGLRCSAAVVTAIDPDGVRLAVLNPAGYDFRQDPAANDEGAAAGEPTGLCGGLVYAAGTWHHMPVTA